MDEDEAEGSEASFFLVGAGEKVSPPPSTATRIPETGGAEVFGSLGALGGLSGDLRAFRLAIVKQRGGAKTTEKLSTRGDDSGKRKRRMTRRSLVREGWALKRIEEFPRGHVLPYVCIHPAPRVCHHKDV